MICAPWIQTYMNKKFDFDEIHADQINILDIAHALSLICRYTGHCREFYSVAQHCVIVSHIVPPEYALEGLLHDAHEAYISDMSTPLKQYIGATKYSQLAKRLDLAIGEKFCANLSPEYPVVKHADMVALATEVRDLLGPHPAEWISMPKPLLEPIECMTPDIAETAFLERFFDLWEERDHAN